MNSIFSSLLLSFNKNILYYNFKRFIFQRTFKNTDMKFLKKFITNFILTSDMLAVKPTLRYNH